MMLKLYAEHLTSSAHEATDREVYLASEVDARIAVLVSALKACSFVISRHIEAAQVSVRQSAEALNEADKALSL